MSNEKVSCVYPRLQLAYLLQFAIWGSWNIALGGFLNSKGITGEALLPNGSGYIFMAIPLGAIIAPLLIGPIADRFFAAQKVLGLLHLISGACLVGSGFVCAKGMQTGIIDFWHLMTLMLISGICYMPTIPLLNTVVFKHIPNKDKAPMVFIFGTAGWILINLVVEIFFGGANKPNFFFIGGGCGLFLGLYSFLLPSTPPKGAPAEGEKSDALGLGAFKLLKTRTFFVFLLCAFMVSLFGSNYYFPALVPYLSENGYPAPLALGTLNQFSELFFMAILGLCVAKIGLKWVLVFGMLAWPLRYFIFTNDGFQFALIGLLLHGLAYAFLYTAAYMFGDKVAPPHLKASVQSLIAFLVLGVGQIVSGYVYEYQLKQSAPPMNGYVTAEKDAKGKAVVKQFPVWDDPKMETSNWRFLDLAKSYRYFTGNKEAFKAGVNLGSYQNEAGKIDFEKIPAEGFKIGDITYTKEELKGAFTQIKDKLSLKSDDLTRADYLKVQRHDWKNYFTIPAIFIIVWGLIFALFGKEPANSEAKEEQNGSEVKEEAPSAA